MEKTQPIGYADDAQIEDWKKKHKNVHEITTTDEDGNEHVTYVKNPTLDLLQLLANKAKQNQELKGLEMVFDAVKLGGSKEIDNDEMMKLAAMKATGKIFKRKDATIKKR